MIGSDFYKKEGGFIDLSALIVFIIFILFAYLSIPVALGFLVLGFIFSKRYPEEYKKKWRLMPIQGALLVFVFLLPLVLGQVADIIFLGTGDFMYFFIPASLSTLLLFLLGGTFMKWLHGNKDMEALLNKYGYRLTYAMQSFVLLSGALVLFFLLYLQFIEPSARSEYEAMGNMFMPFILILGVLNFTVIYYCSRWIRFSDGRKLSEFLVLLILMLPAFFLALSFFI